LERLLADTDIEPVKPQSLFQPDLWFLEMPSPQEPHLPLSLEDVVMSADQIEHTFMINAPSQQVIQFSPHLIERLRRQELAGGFRGGHYCTYKHPHTSESDPQISIDVLFEDQERTICRALVSIIDQYEPFDQEESVVTLRFGTTTLQRITDNQ